MKKNQIIKARVTEETYNLLKKATKGKNLSKKVREIFETYFEVKYLKIAEQRILLRKNSINDILELTNTIEKSNNEVTWMLGNIANNLNQIAYKTNSNKFLSKKDVIETMRIANKIENFMIEHRKTIQTLNENIANIINLEVQLLNKKNA